MIIRASSLFVAIAAYLIGSILLYAFGPINWEETNNSLLYLYVATIYGSIFCGWYLGFKLPSRTFNSRHIEKKKVGSFYLFLGALAYVNLNLYAATGEWVAQVDLNSNLLANYIQMVKFAEQRSYFVSAWTLIIVLPIFLTLYIKYLINFISEKKSAYSIIGFIIFLYILGVFLFRKAADKELLEFVLIIVLTILSVKTIKLEFRTLLIGLLGALAFMLAIYLRKSERVADFACIWNYCSTSAIETEFQQAYVILSSYISQGYKGLSVALHTDQWPNGYLCISPMFNSWQNSMFGACGDGGVYVNEINSSGQWSSRGLWISSFVWYANAISFYGVILAFFVHAVVFGFAVKNLAQRKMNAEIKFWDFIFLFYSLIFYIYMPANNQVFLSFDSAILFMVSGILVLWKMKIFGRKY